MAMIKWNWDAWRAQAQHGNDWKHTKFEWVSDTNFYKILTCEGERMNRSRNRRTDNFSSPFILIFSKAKCVVIRYSHIQKESSRFLFLFRWDNENRKSKLQKCDCTRANTQQKSKVKQKMGIWKNSRSHSCVRPNESVTNNDSYTRHVYVLWSERERSENLAKKFGQRQPHVRQHSQPTPDSTQSRTQSLLIDNGFGFLSQTSTFLTNYNASNELDPGATAYISVLSAKLGYSVPLLPIQTQMSTVMFIIVFRSFVRSFFLCFLYVPSSLFPSCHCALHFICHFTHPHYSMSEFVHQFILWAKLSSSVFS